MLEISHTFFTKWVEFDDSFGEVFGNHSFLISVCLYPFLWKFYWSQLKENAPNSSIIVFNHLTVSKHLNDDLHQNFCWYCYYPETMFFLSTLKKKIILNHFERGESYIEATQKIWEDSVKANWPSLLTELKLFSFLSTTN